MTDFSFAGFLLSLAAAAALLIWSVRLVRTGVERAYGRQLRGWMARSARSRLLAAGSGLGAALLLQSATAVLALVAGFSGSGALQVATGTAVLLGADLGSALVVALISLHVSDAMPLLLLTGVILFLKGMTGNIRQVGRILIGLALIFVSLQMIRDAAEPLIGHAGIGAALGYLGRDTASAFLIGALLAWLVHSSVATVLLVVTLAANGLLEREAAAAIVLGANFGGCLIAVGLTLSAHSAARSIVYANLIARGGGAICLLVLLRSGLVPTAMFGDDTAMAVVVLHVVFNAAVLVAVLPVVGPLSHLAERIADVFARPEQPALDRLPDPGVFAKAPLRAVPRMRREMVVMAQMVDAMQHEVLPLLMAWDADRAAGIVETALRMRARHVDLKLLAAALQEEGLDVGPDVRDAMSDLMQVGAALDGAASVLSGDLVVIARDLAARGVHFSAVGQKEIRHFAEQVAANAELALLVIEREDPSVAVELIGRKAQIRKLEQDLQAAHLARLSRRNQESIATSSHHQVVLRALKLCNSYIAHVATILLERRGELMATRLAQASTEI